MNPKARYRVSLYRSRANVIFAFASHTWFVVEDNGIVSRWEILFKKHRCPTSWNYLHKDFLPPFSGIEIIPFVRKFLWGGHLIGSIEGEENSLAYRVANFIENSYLTYPYKDFYSLFGPNSNTYPQWVLNNFPEFKVQLPWNSFGKNYAR